MQLKQFIQEYFFNSEPPDTVKLGAADLSNIYSREIKISSTTVHPLYNDSSLDHDLALIKLDEAVEFSFIIAPGCISENDFSDSRILTEVRYSDPTYDYTGKVTEQRTTMKKLTNEECSEFYMGEREIMKEQLCVKDAFPQYSCKV